MQLIAFRIYQNFSGRHVNCRGSIEYYILSKQQQVKEGIYFFYTSFTADQDLQLIYILHKLNNALGDFLFIQIIQPYCHKPDEKNSRANF